MSTTRRLRAASLLLGVGLLGHVSCSSSKDEQPAVEKNAPLVTFVPVQATFMFRDSFSWRHSAPVQHLAYVEQGSLVTMRAARTMVNDPATGATSPVNRPEVWFLPKDGEPPIRFESVGTHADAEPKQTRISWGEHTITLDLDKGAIVGGVYRAPDGTETRVTGDGTGSSSSALLLWDENDDQVSNVLKWAMECQGHIVIKKITEKIEAAKKMVERAVALVTAVKESASRAYKVYTKGPVSGDAAMGPTFPAEPAVDDIVKLAAELEARSVGKEPATHWLPQAYTKTVDGQELVEASWEAPRVRCLKERRTGKTLVHIEQACAASSEACQDSGGTPFPVVPSSCREWCEDSGNLTPLLAGGNDDAYCVDASCVDQFAPADHGYRLLPRTQCCTEGLSEACETPKFDSGPPPTDTGVPTSKKVCGSQFEILSEGTYNASAFCPGDKCNGSGEVKDLSTGLVWSRNTEEFVMRGNITKAQELCTKHGKRLPTLPELRGIANRVCKEAVNWPAGPYKTSTDHPDPSPEWFWCVDVPGGKEDYCINYVGVVCVK